MSNQNGLLQIPEAFHELLTTPKRYKVYYGGRGGAKSWAFAATLLMLGGQRPMRILCARELQVSIADSVHKLLADLIRHYELEYFYEIQKTTILGENGTEFLFKGLKHNATEIKSTEGIDVCWVEEAEKVSSDSWELLIPTVRKEGSEIWISFNPKNPTDATYEQFVFTQRDDALVRKVSWKDNPFFPDVLEKERLHLQKTDPEAYKHIWEGEFDTRYFGGVYSKQIADAAEQGRIKKDLYDPELPVHTAWDLGYDDATAIWFWQVFYGEVRLIEYYENNGQDIAFYCDYLKTKNYKYGLHYAPHDAANKLMAAGGRSIVQQAFEKGVTMQVIPATSQQNSIEAARKTLEVTWIDTEACKEGVEALKQYQFEYDEDKKVFRSKPRHDWASHSCFIGQTNILTQYGLHPIMNQPKEGMVWTLCGWKRYTNLKKTQKNARLVEVVFSDGLSVKCTPDHLFLTESGWKSAESLTTGLRIQSCWIPSPNILMVVYTGYGHLKGILHGAVRNCIERFGRMPLVKYLRGVISIIKTETLPIITSRILNVWTQQSTLNLQLARILMPLGLEVSLKKPETKQLIGTHQRKAGYGIRDTQNAQSLGQNGSEKRNYVLNALKNLMPLFGRAETLKYFAQYHAGMLHIESVKKLDEREDVWCLTVEGTKSFALENGAVVHNCDAFEIIGQVWQEIKAPEQPKPLDIRPPTWDELITAHDAKRKKKKYY